MIRIRQITILTLIALAIIPALATAQISESCKSAMNNQRLKLIVPNAAGGGYDTYARALAPVLDAVTGLQSTVVNMPAAGGLVAYTTLANAGPDELMMMLDNGTDVIRSRVDSGDAKWIERLQSIGVFHSEPSAWVGNADIDIVEAQSLVAATSSAGGIVEFEAAGHALGKEIKFIAGFDGSKELEAALLRGDADIMSPSLTTALKMSKSGDLKIQLLLSDKPDDRVPGVPHIGGEDGLAAMLSKDLPEGERANRIALARIVVDLSLDMRTVFVQSKLRQDLKECLTAAVADAISDPSFKEAANAQGRPVSPMDRAKAQEVWASQLESIDKLAELMAAQ